ncbi:MAG: NAD(P)H-binding protein [Planctomycetota bacterium]|nr:NAD(P)H-binding protein [Planctomycetota bacterium]
MPRHDKLPVVLLGCGDTSRRVATRLLATDRRVIATTRRPERLTTLANAGAVVVGVKVDPTFGLSGLDAMRDAIGDRDVAVVHSVPPLADGAVFRDMTELLLRPIANLVRRVVYISSTGVYGDQTAVDATTDAAPVTPRQHARLEAERTVTALCPSTLILRAAAIYGPDRGLVQRMREGRYRLVGDGSNVGSRIHVEDLAALVTAGIDSDVVGAYPVGDAEPARARDVAAFVAARHDLPLPDAIPASQAHELQRVTRAVDGRAVLEALGVALAYPTYREGMA